MTLRRSAERGKRSAHRRETKKQRRPRRGGIGRRGARSAPTRAGDPAGATARAPRRGAGAAEKAGSGEARVGRPRARHRTRGTAQREQAAAPSDRARPSRKERKSARGSDRQGREERALAQPLPRDGRGR